MLDHVHFIILTYTAFEFKNGLVNVEINTKNNHFIHSTTIVNNLNLIEKWLGYCWKCNH